MGREDELLGDGPVIEGGHQPESDREVLDLCAGLSWMTLPVVLRGLRRMAGEAPVADTEGRA